MEAGKLAEPVSLPFELSLRIRHPSIDPAEVSRVLRMEAKYSFRAGEPRRWRGEKTSVHSESYWLGTVDPNYSPAGAWFASFSRLEAIAREQGRALTRNLGWALSLSARVFLRAKTLFERIRMEGGEVCLLVTLSATAIESFSLTPDVSRIFGDLGITLEFDLTGD
jgi:hypothetical protein